MFENLVAELSYRASSAPFPLWVGAVIFILIIVVGVADWLMNWKGGE